ncbi:SDR family oxidoreductase [Nocardia goodfellowii]|uniref:NAD(P)-dependent dehydrogenase (Short-subunit alcohol dehydrogenase family) n=1 Tax=Nocardia goodfellowii TaxID=882446 RepID=A0ABS4Q8D3_9NOCA|nr:SDR family oxidoreductase [Nocardia goodfellowii]MBP2187957.1 NAD(P)-dependent dehydrogenase (short-subunit alcohol dehydrogenase family) [Nocardia goodfellowii]
MSETETRTTRTALVTGASRGIGRAIAERLARDGVLVAVHFGRNDAAAKEVVAGIEAEGGRAFAVGGDLGGTDFAALLADMDAGFAGFGAPTGLDILVNNAGMTVMKGVDTMTPTEFDTLFATNVRAPFFLVQGLLDRLRAGGRVVNLSSAVTRLAVPDILAYTMTKGAIDSFTRVLAQALGPRGITVNAVAPGYVLTDMNAWLIDNPDGQREASSNVALGRVGRPGDIADIVAYLVGDDARWITGQTLDASGGTAL